MHALINGHEINWENANILDHSDFFYPKLYLESWYIQQQDNVMNREVGILPHVYEGTFHYMHSIIVYLSLHLLPSCPDDGICIDTETLAYFILF